MEKNYNIFWAASNNKREAVRRVLEDGTDVDEVDGKERTALMYAAYENATPVMNLLLGDYCASVDWTDARGRTALMYAASRNQVDAVNLLLQYDADVNAKDENGRTALMYAIYNDAPEVAKLLIDNPTFDNNIRDNDGWSAFMWAVVKESTEIKEMLEKTGVKVNRNDLSKILSKSAFFADPFDNKVKNVSSSAEVNKTSHRDHSKYLFNGKVAGKAPTVYSVIDCFVRENPDLTYPELKKSFPDNLCVNGVVRRIKDISEKGLEDKRYKRIMTPLADGSEIAVSTQWTKYTFENNFINAASEVGLNIDCIDGGDSKNSSIKDEFISYLQAEEGYKPNTAINYASGVEQVQKYFIEHENDELLFFYCSKTDVEKIKEISKYCEEYNDLSPRETQWKNAMKAFVRFLDYKYPKSQRPKAILIKKKR